MLDFPTAPLQHAGSMCSGGWVARLLLSPGEPRSPRPTPGRSGDAVAATGAALMVRTEYFSAVGGLDEAYGEGARTSTSVWRRDDSGLACGWSTPDPWCIWRTPPGSGARNREDRRSSPDAGTPSWDGDAVVNVLMLTIRMQQGYGV